MTDPQALSDSDKALLLYSSIRVASYSPLWETTPKERLNAYRRWVAEFGCESVAAASRAVAEKRRGDLARWRRPDAWQALMRREGRIFRYNRALVMAGSLGCTYCPAVATDADHIIPRRLGGTSQRDNLTPACRGCNLDKGGRTVEQWAADEARPGSKLNAEAVSAIRIAAASGATQRSLADQFGVSRGMIGRVVRRLNWVEVA